MALTCFVVVAAAVFAITFFLTQRNRRKDLYSRVSVVQLSPEEREIVRQSASKLETIEKPVKRYQFGFGGGYKALVNSQSNSSISIRENPFDAYLDCEDDKKVSLEPPVNHEVQDEVKETTQKVNVV